jgi:RNA polymerase sigma-70 factor (ECF subfamily)
MQRTLPLWSWAGEAFPSGDSALLAAARRGEAAALDRLYRSHSRAAYSLALRITGQFDQAEDVVQEAFLKAFERLAGFRGDAPFQAWLRRLVVNAAIDRLRAQRRLQFDVVDVDELAAGSEGPEQPIDALGLLSRLSPAARSVMVLHDLEGYSHAEIAASFGHSESWSKSLLARARARLQRWLAEEA